jgi:hypothetical protein
MNFVIACLLGLTTVIHGKTNISIDDQTIGKMVGNFTQWAQVESQTPEAKKIGVELSKEFAKAEVRIGMSQKKILKPVLKDIKSYMKHLNIDSPFCNVNGYAECVVTYKMDPTDCADIYDCKTEFTKLDTEHQKKIIKKWNANLYDAAHAFRKMNRELMQDFETAKLNS